MNWKKWLANIGALVIAVGLLAIDTEIRNADSNSPYSILYLIAGLWLGFYYYTILPYFNKKK